jgi:hypothetical protein
MHVISGSTPWVFSQKLKAHVSSLEISTVFFMVMWGHLFHYEPPSFWWKWNALRCVSSGYKSLYIHWLMGKLCIANIWFFECPGLQRLAEQSVPTIERIGRERAQGSAVTVRTITLLAASSMVAYGLLGRSHFGQGRRAVSAFTCVISLYKVTKSEIPCCNKAYVVYANCNEMCSMLASCNRLHGH